ncbi:MAG TPA: hypothetical protein VFL91_04835 [Thermomicrobiales bacterium]|nr:hypothetical protein [Thermomicrobiales bacterium]
MTGSKSLRIVAAVKDLFFAVRIGNTLRPRGYRVDVVNTPEALDAALTAEGDPPALLIVDLGFAALDPAARIAAVKADERTRAIPVLAFGSHLDRTGQRAAREAGADRVIANSQLAGSLPALVQRLVRQGGAGGGEGDRG